MININKFVFIRKKLGLSQTELCNGICTQSTLSKFENNGRIPSLKMPGIARPGLYTHRQ